jgi:hypothetical protein
MSSILKITFPLLTTVLLLCSCADSVNPVAPFRPRMIIYSILSSHTDTQYVRVLLTYNPVDNNPLNHSDEQSVTDARVIISEGNQTFVFRDTVIRRRNVSRYSNEIHAYYCYPMRLKANTTYTLYVFSPTYGSAITTSRVPAQGSVTFSTVNILENPDLFPYRDVQNHVSLDPGSGAFLSRLYVVFTAENPWERETERFREKYVEVPILRIAINRNLDQCAISYPTVLKNTIRPPRTGQAPPSLGIIFPFPSYPETIANIRRYNFNVRFKRAVLYLVQFDEPWYKYYANANIFHDKLSVRVDPPADYTNVFGALGVFASMRVDSAVWQLPEFITPFDPQRYPLPITYCQQEVPHIAPKFDPLSWRIP